MGPQGFGGLSNVLSGGVKEVVSNVTGQPSDSDNGAFRRVLTANDFITDGKSIAANDFVPLGTPGFKVPAQERYRWGYGAAEFSNNQGFLYVDIQKDAGAGTQEGLLRVQQRDAQQRNVVTVLEERTDVLDGSKTDRDQMRPLPEQRGYKKVGRDSFLALAMQPDASFTIGTDTDETEILAPVTVYPV